MIKIIGEKVYLRDHVESDFEFYHSWRSDPQVMKFLDWRSYSLDDSTASFKEALRENELNYRKKFFFAVVNKETDSIVGECGFTIYEREAELGYFFMPKFWGYGYATESAKLMVDFCFKSLKLDKVVAECSVENVASEKVMIKSGMTFISHFEVIDKSGNTKTKSKYEIKKL